MIYRCDVCNYIYDSHKGDLEHGIEVGTDLKDLPSNWFCPVCGIEKDYFYPLENYPEKSRIASMLTHIFTQGLKQWHNIHG